MVTYFVIQSFQRGRKGAFIPTLQRHARDQDHCEKLAAAMAGSHDAVVAFSRSGEPETGEWDEAIVLVRHGLVPDEVIESLG